MEMHPKETTSMTVNRKLVKYNMVRGASTWGILCNSQNGVITCIDLKSPKETVKYKCQVTKLCNSCVLAGGKKKKNHGRLFQADDGGFLQRGNYGEFPLVTECILVIVEG